MEQARILTEWLLQHNHLWSELDSATKTRKEYNEDSDAADMLIEVNSQEMTSVLRRRDNWYNACPLLFDGNLMYFDNESFHDDEDIAVSRDNVISWLLNNRLTISENGISVKHNKRYCGKTKSAQKCDAEQMPRINGWYSSKDKVEPNKHTKAISSVIKDTKIVIRNSCLFEGLGGRSLYDVLVGYIATVEDDKQRDALKAYVNENTTDIRLLDNNHLSCKFNEVDDFVYVGEAWLPERGLHSLKNFPTLVRGNLVFERSHFIEDFSEFPVKVEGSVYFNEGSFIENITFPDGVVVNGNFNFDGKNSHYMLMALAMSDIQIGGEINCPLFCGRIETLRDIAEKQKWFVIYEMLKEEGNS